MNIGKSLQIAMIQQDRNTKAVAKELGVTASRVNQIKNMEGVKPDTLNRLAAVFSMQVSEFVALGE